MNIGQLITSLGVDTSGLFLAQKEMENLKKKTEDSTAAMNRNLKEIGNTMKDVGGKMTLFLTTPILAAGAAAFKMASDYNESLNKVQVAFGRNSKEIEAWSNTTLKSIGLSSSAALEMSSLFGDMSTSMGLNTGQAAKMSMSLVQLAGDLASFKNIGIDQAQTALAGVFTGETESLKRLGIVMTETNVQQFAYTQGITKKIEQMGQAEKVMLRYNYIMSVTKNSQGDFTRTSEGAANQMRTFKESLTQVGVMFGQVILPTLTKVIAKVNEMLTWITGLTETQKKWVVGIAAVTAVVGPLLLGLGFLVANVFPLLVTGGAAVVSMFTALKVAMVSNPIMAVALLIGTYAASMLLLSGNINQATESQKKFNEELKRGKELAGMIAPIQKTAAVYSAMSKEQLTDEKTKVAQQLKSEQDFTIQLMAEGKKRIKDSKAIKDLQEEYSKSTNAVWKAGAASRIENLKKDITAELEVEFQGNQQRIKIYKDTLNQIDVASKTAKSETKTATAFDPEKMNAIVDIMKKVAEGEKSIAAISTLFNRDISTTGIEFNKTEDKIKLYSAAIKQLTGLMEEGDPVLKSYVDKLNALQPMAGAIVKKYSTGGVVNAEGKNKVSSSVGGILATPIPGLQAGGLSGAVGDMMILQTKSQQSKENMGQLALAMQTYGAQAQQIIGSYTSLVQSQTQRQLEMVDRVAKAQGKSAEWVAKEKERIQRESNRKQKQAAIAEAMINIAVGVTKAIAQGGILGLITGAVVAAAGMMQIATINAQKMANGGVVPGGYRNDTYPALLSSGETVVPPGKLSSLAVGVGSTQTIRLVGKMVAEGPDLVFVMDHQYKLSKSY